MLNEYDEIVFKKDFVEKGVKKGDKGIVLEVYTNPRIGYQIEVIAKEPEKMGVLVIAHEEDIELDISEEEGLGSAGRNN